MATCEEEVKTQRVPPVVPFREDAVASGRDVDTVGTIRMSVRRRVYADATSTPEKLLVDNVPHLARQRKESTVVRLSLAGTSTDVDSAQRERVLSGFALFGASWQHSLAKKLVSHFQEKQVIKQFFQGIDEYWNDTEKAFEQGANALEEGYQNYIQHLREVTSNDVTSKERIEYILQELKRLKFFLLISHGDLNVSDSIAS